MAYDPGLWAPADLPGHFQVPKFEVPEPPPVDDWLKDLSEEITTYTAEFGQTLNRQQAQLSRVVKLLNRYRVVMDTAPPDASGSGFLYIDTDDGRVYYDDPAADPFAWVAINTFSSPDFTDWDDVRVAASATKPGSSSPNWTNITGGVSTWVFANAQDNFVEFSCQIPHGYLEGSDIYPHVHWGPADAGAGDTRWSLIYSWANMGSQFSGSTTIYVTDTAVGGRANDHLVAAFPAIDGTGMEISSMLLCKLKRLGSSGPDTYGDGANFYEFDFHIEMDSVGSSDREHTK